MASFVPRNHPQQGTRGVVDAVDDRRTPDALFDSLHAEHAFTIDVAASADNHRLDRFFTRADDGLTQSWSDETVWCNPPYSNIAAWVRKAWREVNAGCLKVVMLLPSNRTEQVWWQELVEPFRDRGCGLRTKNLRGRPKFLHPGGNPIVNRVQGGTQTPFGCTVLVFEPCPRCTAMPDRLLSPPVQLAMPSESKE